MLSSATLYVSFEASYVISMGNKESMSTLLHTNMEWKWYFKVQVCFIDVKGRFANGFKAVISSLQ